MLSEIGRVEIWKYIEFNFLKVFGFLNANTDLVIILGLIWNIRVYKFYKK